LLGRDRNAWDETADLVALQRPQFHHGPFSRILFYKIMPFIYAYSGSDVSGDKEISSSTLSTIVDITGCVVASLLPLTSILGLYFIEDELKRLFVIIGSTGVFCLAILAFSHARLIEVFAATSA
jgi:hypothetical protein